VRIVLIGPRGSGKSTVANLLGQKIGWPVASTDEFIEKQNRTSIAELVEKKGWDFFRREEEKAVRFLCRLDEAIIDTGGGVVENSALIPLISSRALVVYLTGKPEALAERIRHDKNRPPLTAEDDPIQEMRQVLTRRDPLYRQAAGLVIETTNIPPARVVSTIERKVKHLGNSGR
jgi:shikimate kinase